ncbi:MAG: hypothetical protein JWR69_214 [Pedosphaera sp.]|nr:hypothetical protein [Pedosphaera sp.]
MKAIWLQKRAVKMANAQERLFSLLTNLTGGTYYRSVEAIDTSFAGGPFATEATFVILPTISNFLYRTNVSVPPSTTIQL